MLLGELSAEAPLTAASKNLVKAMHAAGPINDGRDLVLPLAGRRRPKIDEQTTRYQDAAAGLDLPNMKGHSDEKAS